jgi:hypothetical protein
MLEISLQPISRDDTNSHLVVNGELLQGSKAERLRHGDLKAYVDNPDSSLQMICHTIAELRSYFSQLTLRMHSPFAELSLEAGFLFNWSHHFEYAGPKQKYENLDSLNLIFRVSFQDWVGPWSVVAYDAAIRKAFDASNYVPEFLITLAPKDQSEAGYWIFRFVWLYPTIPTDVTFAVCLRYASTVIETAKAALMAEIDPDTLVTLFDFPQHVSTACEQYLLYFVQFLRDLDIKADATIRREAHKILFSVTPYDGAEALGRIREALAIYVRLPDSPEFAAQAPTYGDIAVQQLQANIFHLRGQLAVADAVLHAKTAQIEALQLSNFSYQQLLANQRHVASIPLLPPNARGADAEPLVPGIIAVTEYEGKGFTINFAEILRRLKRRYRDD